MTAHSEAMAILEEFGIRAIPKHVAPKPGETRAISTLQRMADNHGFDHARLVVQILAETDNNRHPLTECVLDAISNIVTAFQREYPDIFEKETSRVFEFFDRVPIGAIELKYCRALHGVVRRKDALAGLLWERVVRHFGEPQGDLLDDRRRIA